MNILLDDLPEFVNVEGESYFVDTDFRTWIIFEEIVLDPAIDNREKVESLIDLCFTENQPDNVKLAMDSLLYIYGGGKKPSQKKSARKNGEVEIREKQIMSYEHDAPYIFGAFMSQYGIDLNAIDYMHWWKFQALFRSLNSSNKIVEIMSYRAADLGQIENPKERNRIARLQRIYALPQNLSREDKIAMAGAVFAGGMV